jgi:hypothetical protein
MTASDLATRCNDRAEVLRRKMRAAADNGRPRDFRKAQRRYLASKAAARAALVEVTKKRPRSPDQVRRLAEHVNPFCECEERVTIRPVRKSSGGYRLTISGGPIRKAGQHLVYEALRPVTPDDRRLWMSAGRGRDQAVARLKQELAAARLDAEVVLLDIAGFYNSIDRQWLIDTLPLPRAVIENVVCPETYPHEDVRPIMDLNAWAEDRASSRASRHHNHERRSHESESDGHSPDGDPRLYAYGGHRETEHVSGQHEVVSSDAWFDALRGLPQGSPVSSLAAQWAAVDIIRRCPSDIFAMMYGDNLLALAANGQGERVRGTLLHALESSPAGQFCLSQDQVRRIDEGFEYLGYRFRRAGDRVDAAPTARNIHNFTDRVRRLIAGNRPTRFTDARSMINGWIGAFREWDQAEALRQQLLTLAR